MGAFDAALRERSARGFAPIAKGPLSSPGASGQTGEYVLTSMRRSGNLFDGDERVFALVCAQSATDAFVLLPRLRETIYRRNQRRSFQY